ncbi:Transcription factor TFIIIB component B [Orbilia ellipsospora]|uniref:Transcription factor TFIIIB component B n=1 Tax=Orbilia ellipsospora TaxID=2528407 RepID=A0AAV9XHR0_9PEZI
MSFINKSSKKIAPKKPQNRGASVLHVGSTPSSDHTASPAPPSLATGSESRGSSVPPPIGIVTKPLRETPGRDDTTAASHNTTLPPDATTSSHRSPPLSRSVSPTATRRDPSTTPRKPVVRRNPASSSNAAGGIPISMPGASRATPIATPTTRPRSPESHRIQPPRRDPSEDRTKRPRLSTDRETPIPSITVTETSVAPSPSRILSASGTPAPTDTPTAADTAVLDAPDTSIDQNATKPPTKRKRKRAAKDTNTAEGESTEDLSQAVPKEKAKRGRKPKAAPQNAENLEIEPTVVRMTDLCRDTFIGKKSKLYEEIEKIDWLDVVKKQRARKAEIEARKAAGEDVQIETVEQRLERLGRENAVARGSGAGGMAPQMRIVNGQLVLDETSVQVDRRERDVGADGPLEVIEESNLTRRVNSATWSKREKTERWDDDETERFYQALGMFGTDFEMMSKMFVGRSRRMLKNKFVVEERRHPKHITAALKRKIPVNMMEYSKLASREFGEVEEVESELRRIREEHEKGLEAVAAENTALSRERNEAAMAELAKEVNGEATADDKGADKASKRQKKGKQKFVSKQGGGDEAVVLGSVEDFRHLRA